MPPDGTFLTETRFLRGKETAETPSSNSPTWDLQPTVYFSQGTGTRKNVGNGVGGSRGDKAGREWRHVTTQGPLSIPLSLENHGCPYVLVGLSLLAMATPHCCSSLPVWLPSLPLHLTLRLPGTNHNEQVLPSFNVIPVRLQVQFLR